jgi:hypothetical protein
MFYQTRVKRAFVLAILGAVGTTSLPSAAGAWTVSLRGAGPIRLGMTFEQVRKLLADPRAHLEGNEPDVPLQSCAYLESKVSPKGLGIMFAKGRVIRWDVSAPGIRTAAGGSVGDTEDRIMKLYPGQIVVTQHFYDENGHYLTYSPIAKKDRDLGMIFETDGKRVTSFRAGTLEGIALVEGCS